MPQLFRLLPFEKCIVLRTLKHSASEENVKVLQGCLPLGMLYIPLTYVWSVGTIGNAITSSRILKSKNLFNLSYSRFRHFRNKIKSGERPFFVPLGLSGVLNPQAAFSGLQMTLLSPQGRKKQECPLSRLYSYTLTNFCMVAYHVDRCRIYTKLEWNTQPLSIYLNWVLQMLI